MIFAIFVQVNRTINYTRRLPVRACVRACVCVWKNIFSWKFLNVWSFLRRYRDWRYKNVWMTFLNAHGHCRGDGPGDNLKSIRKINRPIIRCVSWRIDPVCVRERTRVCVGNSISSWDMRTMLNRLKVLTSCVVVCFFRQQQQASLRLQTSPPYTAIRLPAALPNPLLPAPGESISLTQGWRVGSIWPLLPSHYLYHYVKTWRHP